MFPCLIDVEQGPRTISASFIFGPTDTQMCAGCGCTLKRQGNRVHGCSLRSEESNIDSIHLYAGSSYRVERLSKNHTLPEEYYRHILNALEATITKDKASNNLLAHARLFVFADKYLISPLKEPTA